MCHGCVTYYLELSTGSQLPILFFSNKKVSFAIQRPILFFTSKRLDDIRCLGILYSIIFCKNKKASQ